MGTQTNSVTAKFDIDEGFMKLSMSQPTKENSMTIVYGGKGTSTKGTEVVNKKSKSLAEILHSTLIKEYAHDK